MASEPFRQLSISRSVFEGMLWHALAENPLECCGLLAGVIRPDGVGEVRLRYPLLNAAASPIEFESESRSHFSADKDIRRRTVLTPRWRPPASAAHRYHGGYCHEPY